LDKVLAAYSPAALPVWGVGIQPSRPVEFGAGRLVPPPIMPGWDC
jgi:hypothetical protein